MYTKIHVNPSKVYKNPWFDTDCHKAKKTMQLSHKLHVKDNFSTDTRTTFILAKKQYLSIIKTKKQNYQQSIKDKCANTKNSNDFWRTIRAYNKKPFSKNPISIPAWEDFYADIYPPLNDDTTNFFGVFDKSLDEPIAIDEVISSLKKMKPGKTPGVDEVNIDFFKNLPTPALELLTSLFNNVMENESTPKTWSEIILILFHKKGDPNNPLNYRGIALCNCISKLFTSILANRLEKWAYENGYLNKFQNGFCRGRSCTDNIYILQSAIHFSLRLKQREVFALFIDFKRAFDSISHSFLWQKLYSMGVSPKFIRNLKKLYDSAFFRVRLDGFYSEEIHVTEGVL